MFSFLVVISLFILTYSHEPGYPEWGYDGDTLPEMWPAIYKQCGGFNQSPVNIDMDRVVVNRNLGPITFIGYNSVLRGVTLENNGHTVKLIPPANAYIAIRDGGLGGTYRLRQCHFHWGLTDIQGTEHTLNEKQFALELQCLHMNEKYSSESQALQMRDGFAALSVFYRASSRPNPLLDKITIAMSAVRNSYSNETIHFGFPLFRLFPKNRGSYVRYFGSFTTPGCEEVVTWTVFTETQKVNVLQTPVFRLMVEGPTTDKEEVLILTNVRPLQSLNNRVIQGSRSFHP
ncbi:carbonic anhydrase 2-like [Centruroides sculpturatus]|uniref:carbonic anhydrase 2-like n=1 Tax=Centruroides sculpturatus TaxID=218467 RepID=UPI000C6DD686|nr:carbonic anhydrase 2-like [Centruroides sculpturatus]XP_023215691.1 carbonic anhydrase 2-like [Centruroides sculpturatus]